MKPLSNIKVVELAGLAPVPFCGMMLRDQGARVIRVDRPNAILTDEVLNRGKESICLNLKQSSHINVLKRLIKSSDVLLDPYRPGVLEKLCLTPSELQRDNPRLIIARLSGYGQIRPEDSADQKKVKSLAGHDINFLAMSGVLSCLGPNDCPQPPVNLLADFGAGAMSCFNGILLALLSRASSGRGQLIDCSISLSCAYLCSFLWRSRDLVPLLWPMPNFRSSNVLDGGAPFYRCYRTLDSKFLAIGALEPQFYRALVHLLGLSENDLPQYDVSAWPSMTAKFAEIFAFRTQQQWLDIISKSEECCVSAVLDLDEAAHFWNKDFFSVDEGHSEPGPQPRISGDTSESYSCEDAYRRHSVGEDTKTILKELGCDENDISCVLASL